MEAQFVEHFVSGLLESPSDSMCFSPYSGVSPRTDDWSEDSSSYLEGCWGDALSNDEPTLSETSSVDATSSPATPFLHFDAGAESCIDTFIYDIVTDQVDSLQIRPAYTIRCPLDLNEVQTRVTVRRRDMDPSRPQFHSIRTRTASLITVFFVGPTNCILQLAERTPRLFFNEAQFKCASEGAVGSQDTLFMLVKLRGASPLATFGFAYGANPNPSGRLFALPSSPNSPSVESFHVVAFEFNLTAIDTTIRNLNGQKELHVDLEVLLPRKEDIQTTFAAFPVIVDIQPGESGRSRPRGGGNRRKSKRSINSSARPRKSLKEQKQELVERKKSLISGVSAPSSPFYAPQESGSDYESTFDYALYQLQQNEYTNPYSLPPTTVPLPPATHHEEILVHALEPYPSSSSMIEGRRVIPAASLAPYNHTFSSPVATSVCYTPANCGATANTSHSGYNNAASCSATNAYSIPFSSMITQPSRAPLPPPQQRTFASDMCSSVSTFIYNSYPSHYNMASIEDQTASSVALPQPRVSPSPSMPMWSSY